MMTMLPMNKLIIQALIIYNSFITNQLKYFPLIWILCGKAAHKDLNRTHKSALQILRSEHYSSKNLYENQWHNSH